VNQTHTRQPRIQYVNKRKLLKLGMATALASGLLGSVTDSQARQS